jgi:hypothetical protein
MNTFSIFPVATLYSAHPLLDVRKHHAKDEQKTQGCLFLANDKERKPMLIIDNM